MSEHDDEREVGETDEEPDPGGPWAKFSTGRDPDEDEDADDADDED